MAVAYSTRIPAIVAGATPAVNAIIWKGGFDILSRSRTMVPVRTGNLKNSSGTVNAPLTSVIYYSADYAYFVEGGTRKMAAQPYLRPAFEAVVPTVIAALRRVLT